MNDQSESFRRLSFDVRSGSMAGIAFGVETPNPDIVFIHATGFNARAYRAMLAPLGERFHVWAIASVEDFAHHLGNWVDGVPDWYDWKTHNFRSTWLGTREIRGFQPYDYQEASAGVICWPGNYAKAVKLKPWRSLQLAKGFLPKIIIRCSLQKKPWMR